MRSCNTNLSHYLLVTCSMFQVLILLVDVYLGYRALPKCHDEINTWIWWKQNWSRFGLIHIIGNWYLLLFTWQSSYFWIMLSLICWPVMHLYLLHYTNSILKICQIWWYLTSEFYDRCVGGWIHVYSLLLQFKVW